MTLFILAAGMGSRFAKDAPKDAAGGADKATAWVNDEFHEYLIDYSIYDAVRAGFDRIVFVIKSRDYHTFRDTVGNRVAGSCVDGRKVTVEYVFQDFRTLVPDEKYPEGRKKPLGTTHALLCAKGVLYDGFAVVNADDYYGPDAYRRAADFLRKADLTKRTFAMVGYTLTRTLSDYGTVNRGVCDVDENGRLKGIVETLNIGKNGDVATYPDENGADRVLPNDTVVSMNFWCFTPAVFDGLEEDFAEFLDDNREDPLKKECLLPNTIGKMIDRGECTVDVLRTDAQWFGMTYYKDLVMVRETLKRLTDEGVYRRNLWQKD